MLLYIIGLILIILSLFENKSKFCCILLLLYMIMLMAYSYGNADYSTYELYYTLYGNNISFSTLFSNNGLFKTMCYIFTKFGLSYKELLIFMTLLGFYNLFSAANKFLINKNILFVLYFLYPYLMDITQIRNFLAMTFLIKGCSFLIKDGNKVKSCLLFCIYDLIASLLHVTFVFYLVFLLIKFINKKNIKYIAPMLFFIEVVVFKYIQEIISALTNIDKTDFYFNENISAFTLIVIIIYFIINIVIVYYISNKHRNEKWINNIYKINILMVLTIPVIYHSFEFLRLYRNVFFLNYICVSYMCQQGFNIKKHNLRNALIWNDSNIVLLNIVIVCLFSLYLFIIHDYLNTVFIPAFEMNRLIFKI